MLSTTPSIISCKNNSGKAWETEDKALDQELAAFRKKNGGKPPNIFYILIDDIGFGDLGSETLNSIRGYKTPSINEFAREGMRLSRMYTEPSCTPTRVAFMTGRQPYRNGMGNTAVDISGFGLAGQGGHPGRDTVGVGLQHRAYRQMAHGRYPGGLAQFPGF